jgi:hypothetical protein
MMTKTNPSRRRLDLDSASAPFSSNNLAVGPKLWLQIESLVLWARGRTRQVEILNFQLRIYEGPSLPPLGVYQLSFL